MSLFSLVILDDFVVESSPRIPTKASSLQGEGRAAYLPRGCNAPAHIRPPIWIFRIDITQTHPMQT